MEYEAHMNRVHHNPNKNYTPTRCPVPKCTTDTLYRYHRDLRKQVRGNHNLSIEAARPYFPSLKAKTKITAQACPIEGCWNLKIIGSNPKLRKHLLSWGHDLTPDQVEACLDDFDELIMIWSYCIIILLGTVLLVGFDGIFQIALLW